MNPSVFGNVDGSETASGRHRKVRRSFITTTVREES